MARRLLKDALAFEFNTNSGRRLALFGELTGWDDELQTGLVEHRLLRRNGARHQNMGLPPRKYQFQCVITGADVHKRYQFLTDAISEDPFGSLTHPRFDHRAAVCDGVSAKEVPGDGIDTILYTIRFTDDELREPPMVSPSAAASASADGAAQLVTMSQTMPGVSPAVKARALSLQTLATKLQVAVGDVSLGAVSVPEVAVQLRDLRAAVAAIDAGAPDVGFYALRAAAHLSYARGLAAYNALLQGRPAMIEYRVESPTSVALLAARLYGGRFARALALEIKQFNRLADPLRLPSGTVLLLSDPQAVRKNGFV